MKNAIFINNMLSIGGVEQFIFELVRKYSKEYDIVVYYRKADNEQLKRLRKYVYVEEFNNQIIETENAFLNYDIMPFLDYIKANKIYEIIHANFKIQNNFVPHVDKRIDKYLAVSESNAQAFYEVTGIKCEVCPNPLSFEECNKPLFLCCAQRFTSEKGFDGVQKIVQALDSDDEIKYYMLIFTDIFYFGNVVNQLNSPNVAIMPKRLDVRPYIYGCDLFLALSKSEGRCYSVGEKLSSGNGKLLITPIPSFFEQGANKENSLILNFDFSNIKEIVEEIRKLYRANNLKKDFEPILYKDVWTKYLAKGKPTYNGYKRYLVKATNVYQKFNVYDNELKCVPSVDKEFVVDDYRLKKLLNYKDGALVRIVKEIKED